MKKISKSAAGYVHIAGTNYQCQDCAAFLPSSDGCAFAAKSEVFKPHGGSNYFLRGKPGTYTTRPSHPMLKIEMGYVENGPGFSCKRCEYFGDRNCQVVDRDSAGDDIGEIHPDGCCNHWSRK